LQQTANNSNRSATPLGLAVAVGRTTYSHVCMRTARSVSVCHSFVLRPEWVRWDLPWFESVVRDCPHHIYYWYCVSHESRRSFIHCCWPASLEQHTLSTYEFLWFRWLQKTRLFCWRLLRRYSDCWF